MRLEPLGEEIEIYVSHSHRFGTDGILLADFAAPKANDRAADLGTGCGIIPFFWCSRGHSGPITCVEISSEAAEMALLTAEHNRLTEQVRVLCADLRSLCSEHPEHRAAYTLVTMNPPYKAADDGAISPDAERSRARHELSCTVQDVCKAARELLTFGGRFCLCQRPDRLCDIMVSMREAGIEPKRLRAVCQRRGSRPMLLLIEGRRGGRSGLTVLPTLYIEDDAGGWSDQMLKIYGNYKKGREQK